MTIQQEIFVNQLAQGFLPWQSGSSWFESIPTEQQLSVLRDLGYMVCQAGAKAEDVVEACKITGLRDTYTPCVLMSKGPAKAQLERILSLHSKEYNRVFLLLVGLLSISDARRRSNKCSSGCSHWWHRNLEDPEVLIKITSEMN